MNRLYKDKMPEAPEVKLLSETIEKGILNKTVREAKILNGKYLEKMSIPNWKALQESLPLKVSRVGCKGKLAYLTFEPKGGQSMSIGIGFGMTGTVHFQPNPDRDHIQLICTDGTVMCYEDYRRFGNWAVYPTEQDLSTKLDSLGIDLLGPLPSDETVLKTFRSKNGWNICKCLMEQSLFSGVGNYIKSESLYRHAINPLSRVRGLSDGELIDLFKTCRDIAQEAYQLQGSSFISYRNNGEKGKYQELFLIYGKTKDPEGRPVKKLATPDGRNTSYVPSHQTKGVDVTVKK
jgi:formamidopyrimidine-DNA glycosylase